MKRFACKKCKRMITSETTCDIEADTKICMEKYGSESWQGRVYINSTTSSVIAETLNISEKGEYAIKVR